MPTVKRIAYIEIDTHAEIAQAFLEIMGGSASFSVDYYFSEKIKSQVDDHGESVFLSDSSVIFGQLKDKKYDLVIIGTVHRFFNTFQTIVARHHAAVIVHNLNFIKASGAGLVKSIFKKDRMYRMKLLWKEGLLRSPEVYRGADHLLVLDEALSSEKFRFLPLFFAKPGIVAQNKSVTVVIPGGVSQQRRDYRHVFTVIRMLQPEKPYHFIFLGKAQGNELRELEKLSQELPHNIRITCFAERVSSEEFTARMQEADVLWCPIQEKTEFFSRQEIYGKTKMTGNLGDAIKFGKWAVFPANYQSGLDFIVPEQKDIVSQFERLKGMPYDFQKKYGKPAVQAKLERLLEELTAI